MQVSLGLFLPQRECGCCDTLKLNHSGPQDFRAVQCASLFIFQLLFQGQAMVEVAGTCDFPFQSCIVQQQIIIVRSLVSGMTQ